MKRHLFFIIVSFCLFTLFINIVQAATKEVVIVTSFPKELFETYKKAFEAKYPGVTVVVKQKQTSEGVTYIRETASKPEADIMWASAVDAFQLLKTEKLLTQYVLPKEIGSKIPAKVGAFPIHNPDRILFRVCPRTTVCLLIACHVRCDVCYPIGAAFGSTSSR